MRYPRHTTQAINRALRHSHGPTGRIPTGWASLALYTMRAGQPPKTRPARGAADDPRGR